MKYDFCDPAFVLGTGAWESALTNTLSPRDRIVTFRIGQFSLLWIEQQKQLNFNVDVVESDWGESANLDILESKLASDKTHDIKAICIVHNETTTGVTNDLTKVRKLLGEYHIFALNLLKNCLNNIASMTLLKFSKLSCICETLLIMFTCNVYINVFSNDIFV
jgi:hypothetical protein